MALSTLREGQRFSTFEEFDQALKKYADENDMVFVSGKTSSIKNANKLLALRGVPPSQHYKDSLKHKHGIFTCKFGGPQRVRSGKGERVLQASFKIGCPVMVKIAATKVDLYIDKFISDHAFHDPSPAELNIIPETRQVDPTDQAALDLLCAANVRPARIRMLLRDTPSGRLTARDIANYKAKRKQEEAGGRSDVEMLEDALCKILESDPGAYINLLKDEDNRLVSLFIQTSRMRKNVLEFGMVILFDHTYKINKNRLPVSIFKVMDGNGVGRCAGIGYVVNEEKSTLIGIVSAFAESVGEEAANSVRTVVIDKDYSEAGAIKTVLPNANIQLCDFHVGNTFKSKCAPEKKQVKAIVDDLRYCEESSTFTELCKELEKVASQNFYTYFETNWINCPLAWSFRDNKNSPNLGNTTNNRLENFNGKAKFVTNGDTPLHESVKMLLELVLKREEDSLYAEIYASVKHVYHTHDTDPVMTAMLNEITLYAAKKILDEKKCLAKGVQLRPDTVLDKCGCMHFTHTLLPCRHILQLRQDKGLKWYDKAIVAGMYYKNKEKNAQVNEFPRVAARVAPTQIEPKTGPKKYSLAKTRAIELASIMSESSGVSFRQKYQALGDIRKYWSEGFEIAVVKIVGDNQVPQGTFDDVVFHEDDGNDNNFEAQPNTIHVSQETNHTEKAPGRMSVIHFGNGSEKPNSSENQNANCFADNKEENLSLLLLVNEIDRTEALTSQSDFDTTPHICFCGVQTTLCDASENSRRPGRKFWKCSLNKCNFWRLVTNLKSKSKPVNQSINDETGQHVDSSSLNDPKTSTQFDVTGEQIESSNQNDVETSSHSDETAQPEVVSINQNVQDSNSQSPLAESVKHKGRPKGLHKTVENKRSRKAKPLVSVEDKARQAKKDRQTRGSQIQDTDVSNVSVGEWTVKSQSRKGGVHTVSRHLSCDEFCLCGFGCDKCLICSCEDFSKKRDKRACKHIFKIADMITTQSYEFEKDPWRQNCIHCVKHVEFNGTDFCVICWAPVHTGETSCSVPMGKEWQCLKCHAPSGDLASLETSSKDKEKSPSCKIDVITIYSDDDDDYIPDLIKSEIVEDEHDPGPNLHPVCILCAISPPTVDSAHKCAFCGKPVHAFGCSVRRPGGSEGYGGDAHLCLDCADTEHTTAESIIPPAHLTSNVTTRKRKTTTDQALEDILEELNDTEDARPKRARNMPQRLRNSYTFDTP